MKKRSVSKSAFFNPRALISFSLCSIGLLLAVLVFTAFPSSTALAVPDTCDPVEFTEHQYTYGGPIYVKLDSGGDTTCTIFYRISSSPVGYPAHVGSTPTAPTQVYPAPPFAGLGVPYGSVRYISAVAYKYHAVPTEDSEDTYHFVDHTGN